jgi:hypothetical protein
MAATTPKSMGRSHAVLFRTLSNAILERDDFSSRRHSALAFWWSMIFSENRYPLFGIMLCFLNSVIAYHRYRDERRYH